MPRKYIVYGGELSYFTRKLEAAMVFYGAEFDLALCGYAGYSHAIIPDVDDNFAANLAAVYSSIRSTYTRQWDETGDEAHKKLIETNPIQKVDSQKHMENI